MTNTGGLQTKSIAIKGISKGQAQFSKVVQCYTPIGMKMQGDVTG